MSFLMLVKPKDVVPKRSRKRLSKQLGARGRSSEPLFRDAPSPLYSELILCADNYLLAFTGISYIIALCTT